MRTSKFASLAFTLILAGSVTSGCSTGLNGEKIFGKVQSEGWHETATWDAKDEYVTPYFRGYGLEKGHPKFAKCQEIVEKDVGLLSSQVDTEPVLT